MDPHERAAVFRRLTPKTTFLMPFLAIATVTASFKLSARLGYSLTSPKTIIALYIVAILSIQGFGN
jgi:hypothetical protein